MANAELKYGNRKADTHATPASRRNAARPAYQPYTPPGTGERRAAPAPQRNEADYHQAPQLKILTPAEIRAIVLVVLVVTAVAMGIILLSAEAAVTQKEINDLKRDITQTEDDIANLKIEIEQSQNMQLIKRRAQEELGLQAPSFDQYVYVSELPEVQADFGRYIKEKAYGGTAEQTAEPEPEQDPEQ